jgi:predicted transcriptional regulator
MNQVLNKIGYIASTDALNKSLANRISFLTIGGTPADYQKKRQGEQVALAKKNSKTLSEVRKVVGGSKDGRPKTKNELLADLIKRDKELEKRRAEAERRATETNKRLAAMEKRIAKLLKDAEKNATKTAKKAATKNTSTKKLSSKSSVSGKRSKSDGKRNTTKKPTKGKPKK